MPNPVPPEASLPGRIGSRRGRELVEREFDIRKNVANMQSRFQQATKNAQQTRQLQGA